MWNRAINSSRGEGREGKRDWSSPKSFHTYLARRKRRERLCYMPAVKSQKTGVCDEDEKEEEGVAFFFHPQRKGRKKSEPICVPTEEKGGQ